MPFANTGPINEAALIAEEVVPITFPCSLSGERFESRPTTVGMAMLKQAAIRPTPTSRTITVRLRAGSTRAILITSKAATMIPYP